VESALIGALAAAIVSLIGVMVTWQSSRRSRQEHRDEQTRLQRLDAAMRAGALFSSIDTPIASATIASGLLALTQLDQEDLAVALLVNLWSDDNQHVATETAMLVIDAALRSTRPNAQLVAAELLARNARRLNACQPLHWPSVINGTWDPRFSPMTKSLLIGALVDVALSDAAGECSLRSLAVRLYGIWEGDTDRQVRGIVGQLIHALVPSLKRLGYSELIQGDQRMALTDLEAASASATISPDGFLEQLVDSRRHRLAEWAAPHAP
jgi:hypothetical protein